MIILVFTNNQKVLFLCVQTGFPIPYCLCKAGGSSPTAFLSPSIPCLVQHWQYRQYRHFLETKRAVSGFLWTHIVMPTSNAALRLYKGPLLFCRRSEMVKELHNYWWQTSVVTLSHCRWVLLSSIGTMETSSPAMISKSGLALELPCTVQVLSPLYECSVSSLTVDVFCSSPSHHHVAHTRYKSWPGHADQTFFDQISCSVMWSGESEKERTHVHVATESFILWSQTYIGVLKRPSLKGLLVCS